MTQQIPSQTGRVFSKTIFRLFNVLLIDPVTGTRSHQNVRFGFKHSTLERMKILCRNWETIHRELTELESMGYEFTKLKIGKEIQIRSSEVAYDEENKREFFAKLIALDASHFTFTVGPSTYLLPFFEPCYEDCRVTVFKRSWITPGQIIERGDRIFVKERRDNGPQTCLVPLDYIGQQFSVEVHTQVLRTPVPLQETLTQTVNVLSDPVSPIESKKNKNAFFLSALARHIGAYFAKA